MQALALACLVGGRDVRAERLGVTGSIDLRGKIVSVGGAEGKVEEAHRRQVALLVMPPGNRRRVKTDGWSEGLKQYLEASTAAAADFVDLLELAIDGAAGMGEAAAGGSQELRRRAG